MIKRNKKRPEITTIKIDLNTDMLDCINWQARENQLEPADFISIIFAHLFTEGVTIPYKIEGQDYKLELPSLFDLEATASPQGMG
jgi:hypothetical protein